MMDCPAERAVEVRYPDGKLIVTTNDEMKFDWVRLQIQKHQLKGCYVIFDGNRYEINDYGVIVDYPLDMFGKHDEIASEILKNCVEMRRAKENGTVL
jgi:hypothetical protein